MAPPSMTERWADGEEDITSRQSSPPLSPSEIKRKGERRGITLDTRFSRYEKYNADPNVKITTIPLPKTPTPSLHAKSKSSGLTSHGISNPFSKENVLALGAVLIKFARFTGPGSIISVAYIDPDNLQTAITSGALLDYKLLCMILISNLIAIYLQALSVKLGSVTGMNLAQMNRTYLPRWINIGLWIVAEAAIIAADISQVIGAAIAINILIPQIPLVAGCVLSAADTLFILFFYRPDGSMRGVRIFELFVTVFVLGIFISFCIELSYVTSPVGEIFKGYLPSKEIFVDRGLYQSCAIIGGTIMPHTLYLGSGLVQPRMRAFDISNAKYYEARVSSSQDAITLYRPSPSAIKACMAYSIAELCITLFVVAVFVNSAVLIVAASLLPDEVGDADLFGIYDTFVDSVSQASGTIFALGLLFSGISAGIVATMAGQMVCEGAMEWRMSPFLRRLLTRSTAIVPGVVIAAILGRDGLAATLNGCNVAVGISLIFVTFPLVLYTSSHKYMLVKIDDEHDAVDGDVGINLLAVSREAGGNMSRTESLANNWATSIGGWLIWILICCMNIAILVFLGLGLVADD